MSLLNQIEPGLLSGAVHIVRNLRENHFSALFAGGVVRDLLLERRIADIDIATSAPPEAIERLFEHTIPVGKQFGVVIVVTGTANYEVATFRKDETYNDGRHPSSVSFTVANIDALRRDFTVNALYLDPETGEVLDFVGGREDLEKKLIRTVGDPDRRFDEDKLRLIRAVRFACDLGFEIEEGTFQQICSRANEIDQVSQERIRDELIKILIGPAPDRGLQLLFDTGLLNGILPEAAAMSGVEQPPEFHPEGDVFVHTKLMLSLSENPSPELALGILLHDIGKPPTFEIRGRIRFDGHAEVGAELAAAICRRLRLSNELADTVVELVRDHLRFMNVREMRQSTLRRFLSKGNFADHLELHRLDCLGSHQDLSNYEFCIEKLGEFAQEPIRPEPLINGHDLIEMGLRPGPLFSDILTAVEDRQLEGEISTREEALKWVRKNWLESP
jgi:poly(A) polymerase